MHAALVAADMRVNAVALGMVVLGVAVLVATLRYWRSAGEDPVTLAPLEVMGDRRFARADDAGRARILNSVRPEGSEQVVHPEAPPVLDHEPAQQERPFRDTFDHSDDYVDVVGDVDPAPRVIDPLLKQSKETQ